MQGEWFEYEANGPNVGPKTRTKKMDVLMDVLKEIQQEGRRRLLAEGGPTSMKAIAEEIKQNFQVYPALSL